MADKTELYEVGQRLLDAAAEYWAACQRNGVPGAVIWLEGSDGRLVIFTRGEYREALMAGVTGLQQPVYFDARRAGEVES